MSCHRLNSVAPNNSQSDLSGALLKPISSEESMINQYPYLKTDLSKNNIEKIWTDTSNNNLLIKTSEDAEENNYLLRFDPTSGSIIDKSNPFHDLGSYKGNSRDFWYFLTSKACTLTMFSKSNLKETIQGDHLFLSLSISSDRILATISSSPTPEYISCYQLNGERLWVTNLNSLLENTKFSDHIFLNPLFERKNQLLLFSYRENDDPKNTCDLYCWLFDRDTGRQIHKDSLGQIQDDKAGTSVDPWEIQEVFYQDDDNFIITRKQKKNLFLEKYFWDGVQSFERQWSILMPEHLKTAISNGDVYLHSKIVSDGSYYWCVLQTTSQPSQGRTLCKSYLLQIDKKSGKNYNVSLISDTMLVKDWELIGDSFVFSLDLYPSEGIIQLDKQNKTTTWQYYWKNSTDEFTDVQLVNQIIMLQTKFSDENQRIHLRMIDRKGKVVPVYSFTDNFKVSELFPSEIYFPDFELFLIPQENKTMLIVTNRGDVYQFDYKNTNDTHF
jgi:hypothetical protein